MRTKENKGVTLISLVVTIIVLIILLIIIGDILTHKFTTKTVAEISREIFLLTESVKNNKDDIQQKLNNIEKAWEKYSEKFNQRQKRTLSALQERIACWGDRLSWFTTVAPTGEVTESIGRSCRGSVRGIRTVAAAVGRRSRRRPFRP